MKFFPIFVLSIGLLVTQNTCPKNCSIEPIPAVAAVITWVAIVPPLSRVINTVPNPLWEVGSLLVGPRDLASRYALGGIVAGTIGTCAAVIVYNLFKSTTQKINRLRR